MRTEVNSKRARSESSGWNRPSNCPTGTHGGTGCSIQLPNSQAFKILTLVFSYNQRIKFQPARRRWESAGQCTLITADIQGPAH